MLKRLYIDNFSFETVTIPRGTLLFRSLLIEKEHNCIELLSDFLGFRKKDALAISPNMNVFFYPVPYVSSVVNNYNVQAIYYTQYDVELILLVKPSKISKENVEQSDKNSPITICKYVKDKCELGEYAKYDVCLSDKIIDKYPFINGYIALFDSDVKSFRSCYEELINSPSKITQIIPSILENSSGLKGVPEIALHPNYFREPDCFISNRFRSCRECVRYCISNRAKFNYFPLLYINGTNIYNMTDLMDMEAVKTIRNVEFYSNDVVENIMNILLSENGHIIQNTPYLVKLDAQTGFYILILNKLSQKLSPRYDKNQTVKNTITQKGKIYNDEKYIYTTFTMPNNSLIKHFVSHSKFLNILLSNLTRNGHNLRKEYIFNKGNPEDFIIDFKVNSALDIPEYREIRKKKYNKTVKNKERQINSAYSFYGLEDDLDNI